MTEEWPPRDADEIVDQLRALWWRHAPTSAAPLPDVELDLIEAAAACIDRLRVKLHRFDGEVFVLPQRDGRWLVITNGKTDGWSYPTREAAEAAVTTPDWADEYKVRAGWLCAPKPPGPR